MAGRIPQQFIDDLIARADIVELIDARVPLKKAGREYTACCPFHGEKTPSFTVSPTKQFYHCFGCGAHGTALGFMMEYEQLEFVEAVEELAKHLGVPVPREAGTGHAVPRDSTAPLYEVLELAAAWFAKQLREHPQAQSCVDYLKERGLSGAIAKTFGLGFAPPGWDGLLNALGDSETRRAALEGAGLIVHKEEGRYYDRFRNRVMFPIRDRRGRVIAFGGRVLGDDSPKYMNSPETPVFHKGRELYGLHEVRENVTNPVRLLVVEGYMDAVALHQFGIGYTIATLGTATTGEHLEKIFRIVPEVVFCFDGDRAGRAAAWRALENALPVMRDGRQAAFLFLPDGEDPDSLIRKEGTAAFEARIGAAMPLSEFIFAKLREGLDTGTPDGCARLVELARPLLGKLPDGVFRQLMTGRLAKIAQLDVASLAPRLNNPSKHPATSPARRPRPEPGLSAVRQAITLLLHDATLATSAADRIMTLADDPTPGLALLVELTVFCRDHPQATLPVILENWRDKPDVKHLAKLASQDLAIPRTGLQAEFSDAMTRILDQHDARRWQVLQQKLQAEGLTDPEKKEWQQLLSKKSPQRDPAGTTNKRPGNPGET